MKKEILDFLKGIAISLICLAIFTFSIMYMYKSHFSFLGILCFIGGCLIMSNGLPSFSSNNKDNNSSNKVDTSNTTTNFWNTFNRLPRDLRMNLYDDYMKKR